MERDFDNDEFEIFLKQKADQHKLYPSDKAWNGIYNSLHPGMKWFKIGGTLLVLSTLFFVYQETSVFNYTDSLSNKTSGNNSATLTNVDNRKNSQSFTGSFIQPSDKSLTTGSFYPSIENASIPFLALPTSQVQHFYGNSNQGSPVVGNGTIVNSSPVSTLSNNIGVVNAGSKLNAQVGANHQLKSFFLHNDNLLSLNSTANVSIPANHVAVVDTKNDHAVAEAGNEVSKPISSVIIGNTIKTEEEVSVKDINWLQEMAAIKLTPLKKGKFNLQFYFSPTVSYRRLADNQNTSHSSLLNANSVSSRLNVNKYVDHNPAIGAELGSSMLFSVSRNFILKSGLQLNYSRYNIRAFKSTYEKASIALSTAGRIADTISSYTSLRNFTGYASEDLQNQYLQVSIPIGAELKLIGNKRLQFSVAGTIQPTFLLFSDTYLLSTNYMNYTKEPSLVRKWNVHSAFEAFLSYKTGGLRWQLGPQFRYQLMSSFNDRYPIKEYLFEYGVKIGVSKTLR